MQKQSWSSWPRRNDFFPVSCNNADFWTNCNVFRTICNVLEKKRVYFCGHVKLINDECMKRRIYLLGFITMLCVVGCSEDFTADEYGKLQTKSFDTSRFLDISTTDITAMTEADFQAFDAAMERMEVEYNGRYYVIQRTDYKNLNISKQLYWLIKQLCENGNRWVASIHHDSSFPLIKNRNPETGYQSADSDCVAYALYGMGGSLQSALYYINTYYPDGVPLEDIDGIVDMFCPGSIRCDSLTQSGVWLSPPHPMVCARTSAIEGHAANLTRYTHETHTIMYKNYRHEFDSDYPVGGMVNDSEVFCIYFPPSNR